MAGMFDDLIPAGAKTAPAGGMFDDLIPQKPAAPGGYEPSSVWPEPLRGLMKFMQGPARDVAGRATTNVVTGIPDALGAVVNQGLRKAGVDAQIPLPGPALRKAVGVNEMDPNAGLAQKIGENALGMALGSGIAGPAFVGPTTPGIADYGWKLLGLGTDATLSTLASDYLGQKFGELGSVLGGAGGAAARPMMGPTAARAINAVGGKPQGGAIYDASVNREIRPTAGMVGNQTVGNVERGIGAFPLSGFPVNRARDVALADMTQARDAASTGLNGGPMPPQVNVPEIGQRVIDANAGVYGRAQARQDALEQNIGSQTPVDAAPIVTALEQSAAQTDPATAAAVRARGASLESIYPPAPTQTVMGPGGSTYTTTGPQPTTVPYGRLKDWRTRLREDQEGLPAMQGAQLAAGRQAATDAMRTAAQAQGLGPEFDAANQQYTAVLGNGPGASASTRGAPDIIGLNPQEAGNIGLAARNAPEVLDPIVSQGATDQVGAALIHDLGQPRTSGSQYTFSPQDFFREWTAMSPRGRQVWGGRYEQALNDIATAAQDYNLPPQSQGLNKTLGTIAELMSTFGAPALVPLASALESGPVVRSLAGRNGGVGDTLMRIAPRVAVGAGSGVQ